MDVTLVGIVNDVNSELANAPSPNDVTLVGIVIDIRPEYLNACTPNMVK